MGRDAQALLAVDGVLHRGAAPLEALRELCSETLVRLDEEDGLAHLSSPRHPL